VEGDPLGGKLRAAQRPALRRCTRPDKAFFVDPAGDFTAQEALAIVQRSVRPRIGGDLLAAEAEVSSSMTNRGAVFLARSSSRLRRCRLPGLVATVLRGQTFGASEAAPRETAGSGFARDVFLRRAADRRGERSHSPGAVTPSIARPLAMTWRVAWHSPDARCAGRWVARRPEAARGTSRRPW